jgi:hypothetical protein
MRSRELRWAGMMKESVLFVRPEGKRPYVKTKSRWDDNIKIYREEI